MTNLEQIIHRLIDRRELAEKGSAEWTAICEQIGELIEKHPEAAFIAEEYTSNLALDQ